MGGFYPPGKPRRKGAERNDGRFRNLAGRPNPVCLSQHLATGILYSKSYIHPQSHPRAIREKLAGICKGEPDRRGLLMTEGSSAS